MKKTLLLVICLAFFSQGFSQNVPSYVPTNGLSGWWPFTNTSLDFSGNGRHGLLFGATDTSDRFGMPSSAFFFDGIDDYIEIAHHPDLKKFPFSVAFWLKTDSASLNPTGAAAIIDAYTAPSWNGILLHTANQQSDSAQMPIYYVNGTNNGIYQTYASGQSNPFPWIRAFDNQWHHVAWVVDSTGSTLYLDAQVIHQQAWFEPNGTPTGLPIEPTSLDPINIARRGSFNGDYFHGHLDDIGIWNAALTPAEVSALYNASASSLNSAIFGMVFNDVDSNCIQDNNETGIFNLNVIVNPGNIVLPAIGGYFFLDGLAPGTYSVSVDTTTSHWTTNCPTSQTVTVGGAPSYVYFPMTSTNPCSGPRISISAPFLRRCNTHPLGVFVSACNDILASNPITPATVEVQFDPSITVVNATLPYTQVGNKFIFSVGTINPGSCVNFSIGVDVDCNASIGQTLCMEAVLLPLDSCALDTNPGPGNCNLPWDRSSLSVTGECVGDSLACFTIENTGDPIDGDMDCWSQVRVYYDGILTEVDSVLLAGGTNTTLCFPANGQTIRLEVDQHPLHPGNSNPNAVVELCGDSVNWTSGLVGAQALNDADPHVDVFCAPIVGSFDPNDKQGFPTGVGVDNEILPNQDLNYLIRFQNTGNDTAFTIIIRDTLDANLNMFTLQNGASSHPNVFRILPGRVLEWRFNNILLPDSNVNEPESHGFVSFTISQVPDLSDFTELNNTAYIYFDGNAPVITNQTQHTIKRPQVIITQIGQVNARKSPLLVYPNPAADYFTIRVADAISGEVGQIAILDLNGKRVVLQQVPIRPEVTVSSSALPAGVYLLQVQMNGGMVYTQKLVLMK